jgi:ssDNA-binding Zn-finger/Zn-ribbon topoisomerase 1
MTSKELSKTISGELYLGNKECALFLANYLVKRFPDSDEAQDLAESANFNPGMINCPTCRNGISMKAPSCPHCGELLTDELRKKSTFITDLSNYVRKIDEKTKIVEKKGGAFGFLLGIPIAIVTLSLGIFLSGIPGLNLIGMPLTFVSILIPFVLPFMKYSFISGLCPYCSHQVLIQDNRTAASCPTCKNRIIITSNRFCRIS